MLTYRLASPDSYRIKFDGVEETALAAFKLASPIANPARDERWRMKWDVTSIVEAVKGDAILQVLLLALLIDVLMAWVWLWT